MMHRPPFVTREGRSGVLSFLRCTPLMPCPCTPLKSNRDLNPNLHPKPNSKPNPNPNSKNKGRVSHSTLDVFERLSANPPKFKGTETEQKEQLAAFRFALKVR